MGRPEEAQGLPFFLGMPHFADEDEEASSVRLRWAPSSLERRHDAGYGLRSPHETPKRESIRYGLGEVDGGQARVTTYHLTMIYVLTNIPFYCYHIFLILYLPFRRTGFGNRDDTIAKRQKLFQSHQHQLALYASIRV